jgi:hypothetical protein
MHLTQFTKLAFEPMAERTLGAQFIEKRFSAFKGFLTQAVFKKTIPTSRDFVFGKHLKIPLCDRARDQDHSSNLIIIGNRVSSK